MQQTEISAQFTLFLARVCVGSQSKDEELEEGEQPALERYQPNLFVPRHFGFVLLSSRITSVLGFGEWVGPPIECHAEVPNGEYGNSGASTFNSRCRRQEVDRCFPEKQSAE